MNDRRTQLVLLGTGTPNADPQRHGMALAVVVDDVPYLVDFGPGVVRRAAEAHANGVSGLKMENLKTAFLTHLHHDHTAGLPDLLLTPWTLGRADPLAIYGPRGTNDMARHIVAAYEADIQERLGGLEPANASGYRVAVTEFAEAGMWYRDGRVTVEAIRVDHGSWDAFGFKFTTPDRVILISGDTAPVDALREHPCDILVHEVYSVTGFQQKPPAWQAYHRAVHTSAYELADLANHLKPSLVVMVHHLFWGVSEDDLVAEVTSRYDGHVVCGRDLDVY